MGKSTVVSIVPFRIHEEKPGLYPGIFDIPPAQDGDFEVLVVSDAQYPIYKLDGEQILVPELSETVAKSIVNDFISSHLAVGEGAKPGIFWLTGEKTKAQVSKDHQVELIEARESQKLWFKRLVEMADDDWSKFGQRKMISDLQRHAAKSLKLDRPWIDVSTEDITICPACRSRVSALAIVCQNCKAILDPEKYKQLKFAV